MDTPIKRLLDYYSNISACAKALGKSRQHIQIWQRQGFIPFKQGAFIEEKTNGAIKASEVYEAAAKALR